jgi:hypothetical protein
MRRKRMAKKKVHDTLLLGLTKAEADMLRSVLSQVGGDPERTRRGLSDSVWSKLGRLKAHSSSSDITGTLYFREVRP